MKNKKVMELYQKMYDLLEKMAGSSIKEIMGDEYEEFNNKFIENIEALCMDNREFLINEGYFIYCFKSTSNPNRVNLWVCINNLEYFRKNSDMSLTVSYLSGYIKYIMSLKNKVLEYDKIINDKNNPEEKDKIKKMRKFWNNYLNNKVDVNLMNNINTYIKSYTTIYLNVDYFARIIEEVLNIVFIYTYINSQEDKLLEICRIININDIFKELSFNGLIYRNEAGQICYHDINAISKFLCQYLDENYLNDKIYEKQKIK